MPRCLDARRTRPIGKNSIFRQHGPANTIRDGATDCASVSAAGWNGKSLPQMKTHARSRHYLPGGGGNARPDTFTQRFSVNAGCASEPDIGRTPPTFGPCRNGDDRRQILHARARQSRGDVGRLVPKSMWLESWRWVVLRKSSGLGGVWWWRWFPFRWLDDDLKQGMAAHRAATLRLSPIRCTS